MSTFFNCTSFLSITFYTDVGSVGPQLWFNEDQPQTSQVLRWVWELKNVVYTNPSDYTIWTLLMDVTCKNYIINVYKVYLLIHLSFNIAFWANIFPIFLGYEEINTLYTSNITNKNIKLIGVSDPARVENDWIRIRP